MLKYIERDLTMRPVNDFRMNVQPLLTNTTLAEEVYEGKLLVGWKIVSIYGGK
jgi:hypothetical protein